MLYHISTKRYLTELEPKIPRTINNTEDNTTPRICFAPSINCCLRSIAEDGCYITHPVNRYVESNHVMTFDDSLVLSNMITGSDPGEALLSNLMDSITQGEIKYPIYHAYIPIDVEYSEFYTPTPEEVFDQQYTHEVWLKRPCETKCVFSFAVINVSVVQEFPLFNQRNKVTDTYQLKDYMIQIIPSDILSMYVTCDDMSRRDQIELFKLRHQRGDNK